MITRTGAPGLGPGDPGVSQGGSLGRCDDLMEKPLVCRQQSPPNISVHAPRGRNPWGRRVSPKNDCPAGRHQLRHTILKSVRERAEDVLLPRANGQTQVDKSALLHSACNPSQPEHQLKDIHLNHQFTQNRSSHHSSMQVRVKLFSLEDLNLYCYGSLQAAGCRGGGNYGESLLLP